MEIHGVDRRKKNETEVDLPNGHLGELVRELQQLRWASDAAEWTLLKRCQEVDASNEWHGAFKTFDTLLERFNVCAPRRYREFVAAEETLGETRELAQRAGMSSVIQAATIDSKGVRAKYLEAATARAEATGVPWSDQQARSMRDKFAGSPPKISTWNNRVDELMKLRAENVRLQQENRALKKEIEAKGKELAKLTAAVKAKKKS